MITVRQIREEDAPAFRDVLDQVCRERNYLARVEAPPLEDARAFVSANVKAGHPQFVAFDNPKLVGWCDALPGGVLSGMRHVGTLGMGVLREYRGQGIGRRLIEATIARATELGFEKIELTVHASNERAISLYRRIGFSEEGRRKRAWFLDGRYDDLIHMALHLGGQSMSSTTANR